jgi:hypothetical protein
LKTFHRIALISTLATVCGCTSADLVLHNGKVVTVDDRLGTVEAIAVRGDRILAVGTNDEVSRHVGSRTRVIDLDGRLAMPGFIDSHGHFTSIGEAKLNLDLRSVNNWSEVVDMVRIAAASAKPGEWILGRGWHQDKWNRPPPNSVEGFPTHESLSAISPNNPVCLEHASGHACFFNAHAMALAKVDQHTPDPAGGEILHNNEGHPIGVFRETAEALVTAVHAQQMAEDATTSESRLRRAIRLADEDCLSKGVTSFQDAGSSFKTIDIIQDMVRRGEIGTRLWVMVREPNDQLKTHLARYLVSQDFGHRLSVRAIKRTIDGALGSRGAWLIEPYSDSPHSCGLSTTSVEDVATTAQIAREHGVQLCVHAIGDRANREVLGIFEQCFDSPDALRSRRWRVEHAQHLHPDDIPRFARLGVIASMQAVHCTSDAPFVIDRVGYDRAHSGAYVWRTLWDLGTVISNGTDAPVEDVDPIACYYSTVSRLTSDGAAFFPDQRLTRMEALKSYTINSAYAAFEENLKGSLKPGKLADIVVLSDDILTCPMEQIPKARVQYTIVGGEVLYEAAPAP